MLASHSETCAFGFTALTVYAEEERRVGSHGLCPALLKLYAEEERRVGPHDLCPALLKLHAVCELEYEGGINASFTNAMKIIKPYDHMCAV